MRYQYNPAEKSVETVVVNFPADHVFQTALSAFSNDKRYKVKDSNQVLHRISFQTKASALSWGEKMTLQLNDRNGQTEIVIASELKTSVGSQGIGTQATIGKKNKKNIDNVLTLISQHL